MRASGTFTVKSFVPAEVTVPGEVSTAVPTGVATMEKHFEGAITGRSTTLFTAAYDDEKGVGTYVAMESFEGSVDGREGSFNFAHAATTTGDVSRLGEYFVIVPASSTGELTGIGGTGGIAVDEDGTHRIWFDYEIG
ncbi:DUF3224 domain-containing protein [Streptomyces sp. NPDC050418]|uniref:DUF3224 domain-containing protein n=1 Tax=Streptomyces sp. NPDC050418 TaxID=3365612 RepID=UPI0037A32B57